MNIANGPVRPTPGNLHPPIDYCIQLTLPNDREWIAAFYDALYQLTYWFAWQRDNDHTGKDIAAIWLSVLANMRPCKPAPSKDGCCDGGEPLYRQNPDNPCILESSADGVHWCTLFDVSLCTPATGQPGGGAEQPEPGGGEKCYHINMQAPYQALVPTVVNAGDMITFSNFGGAANSGTPGRWDCPDGKYFFAGTCQDGTEGYSILDPLPSAPNMSLIAQIDGVWYSCLSPITVPGGVVNAQILIQLNDNAIGDNQGQYAVDVCVTNNAALEWTVLLDYATGNLFTIYNDPLYADGPLGVWQAGMGYNENVVATAALSNYFTYIDIYKEWSVATELTGLTVWFDQVPGANGAAGAVGNYLRYKDGAGVWHQIAFQSLASGTGQTIDWTGSQTAKGLEAYCWIGDNAYGAGSPGGTGRIYRAVVTGKGPNPFV